ncbi:23S rRNA pseudouridine2605 synthase [Aurantimicrobium minutum]|uniref:primosomal protein n=1 Tax=Aurantimicrobium minutum TaxID=708131 RepID=UPI002474208D|nr:primosomal protein [Aurantimicrobium minutum]MDH6424549.1 23S rRNA pseudouridine2605 synthase [Aurantimicrobium minutum]
MSDNNEDFGTPDRADRPRRDGQGPRNNRSEGSREERPNRYGVPRDGQSRQQRGDRPAAGRGERPTYGDRASRPDRSDRPGYADRGQRGERPSYGDRPQRGDRPSYGDRPDRGERPRYGDRDGVPRGDRPRYGDRDGAPRGERPAYGNRDGAPHGDRPYRPAGDRPTYGDRGDRNARPERGGFGRGGSNGAPRGERPGGDRGGKPSFGDRNGRPERSDRPSYGDRPQRGDRPSYGDRGPRPERTERPSYGDRPQRGDRPSYGNRDGAPRGDRPSYGDRGPRPNRGGDRPSYGDRGPRPERSERPSYGDRPQRGDRPSYGDRGPRSDRYGGRPSYGDRPERPRFGDRGGRPDRAGAPRGGRDSGGRDDRTSRWEEPELTEEQRMARELRMVRPHHDDPWIDDDVTGDELDKVARNELKTLTKENAERVAKHLVMAVRLMDENPELAHQHVLSAARRAGRIAIVRETLGITAYAIGDFALALRELRTYRRISGSNEQIALMVDAERGVGRPDKALELGRSVERSTLSEATQVALSIAMSGARLDLDQVDLALAELEIPQLDPTKAFTYSPALFNAYAEVLEELGRHQEAAEWTTCAEVAEKALVAADLMESSDEDEQDIVVFEEELEEDELELVSEGLVDNEGLALADVISSGAFEESDSAEVELSSEEEDALIAEGISPDDLLEDDVRQILIETAHLDAEGDKA